MKNRRKSKLYWYLEDTMMDKIVHSVKDFDMLFIGENPHHYESINQKVKEILRILAEKTDYKIYARESDYSFYPFLEEKSNSKNTDKYLSGRMRKSNEKNKIISTAIDLPHSIKHSINNIEKFLRDFISKKIKEEYCEHFVKICSELLNPDNNKKIQTIDDFLKFGNDKILTRTFLENEELIFFFKLLKITLVTDGPRTQEKINVRNKYYIKTIEKAMERNPGKIVCHTGSPHAYKKYINEDDYYIGEHPEAEYFMNQNKKVYSIQIRPFYLGRMGEKITIIDDKIEKKALSKIGDGNSIFIDLHEYEKEKHNDGIKRYFNEREEFQFDGIIYIRELGV